MTSQPLAWKALTGAISALDVMIVLISGNTEMFAGSLPCFLHTHTPLPYRIFFRRHYPLATISFCDMDPENRKWVLFSLNLIANIEDWTDFQAIFRHIFKAISRCTTQEKLGAKNKGCYLILPYPELQQILVTKNPPSQRKL